MNNDLVDRFALYLSGELHRTEGTVRQYLYRIRFLEEWTGKPIEEVTADDLRRLKANPQGYSSSHIKSMIVTLRQFHSWGVLEGLWQPGSIAALKVPKEDCRESAPLPDDKARTLLEKAEGSLETRLVYLGLYAGMRIGESASLTDEEWQDGWLRFRGEKTNKLREVPVHPDLADERDAILSYATPHKASMQKAKERLEKRVGFAFISHQLRKSFSSKLHDEGVSDRVVKDLIGHTQDVTGRYIVVSRRMKQQAIAKLDWHALREGTPDLPTSQDVSGRDLDSTENLVEPTPLFSPGVWSVGVENRIPYLFDLKAGEYHYCPGDFDFMLLDGHGDAGCGRRFRIVDDETAAEMLSKNPVTARYCRCMEAAAEVPRAAYPLRLQRKLGLA